MIINLPPRFEAAAHAIKGVAAELRAEPCRKAASDLEMAARAGTTDPALATALASHLDRLVANLENIRSAN